MNIILPENEKFYISKTNVTWYKKEGQIFFSRAINGTLKSIQLPCVDATQFVERLEQTSKMKDSDFAWLCDF